MERVEQISLDPKRTTNKLGSKYTAKKVKLQSERDITTHQNTAKVESKSVQFNVTKLFSYLKNMLSKTVMCDSHDSLHLYNGES